MSKSGPGSKFFRAVELLALSIGTAVAIFFGFSQRKINQEMNQTAAASASLSEIEIKLASQNNLISSMKFAAEAATLLEGDVVEASTDEAVETSDSPVSFPNSFSFWNQQPLVDPNDPQSPSNSREFLRLRESEQAKFRLQPQDVAVDMLVTVARRQPVVSVLGAQTVVAKAAEDNSDEPANGLVTVDYLTPLIKSPDPSVATAALLAATRLLPEDGRSELVLDKVDFSNVIFSGVSPTQLDGINVTNSTFASSLFPSAFTLKNAAFTSTKLDNTCFEGVAFEDSRIERCTLNAANFAGASFTDTTVGRASSKVTARNIDMAGASFSNGSLIGDFEGATLGNVTFTDVDVRNSTFNSSSSLAIQVDAAASLGLATERDNSVSFIGTTNLSDSQFVNGCVLNRAYFAPTVSISNTSFADAQLAFSNFSGVEIPAKSNAESEEVKPAGFRGASLFGASFESCKLQRTNFSGSSLGSANFSKADVRKSNFADATFDETTDWTDADIALSVFSFDSTLFEINVEANQLAVTDNLSRCGSFEKSSIVVVGKLPEPVEGLTHVYIGSIDDVRIEIPGDRFRWVNGYNGTKINVLSGQESNDSLKQRLRNDWKVLIDKDVANTFLNPAAPVPAES